VSQVGTKIEMTPEVKAQLSFKDWYASTKKKAERPPLTPEEQARPFAKYYRDPVPPDPEHYAKMDNPSDPSKAIFPEQMNDLLNPGYLDVEIGWCNLPNGAGFIANCYQHKDVTAAMIDWWFAWHTLEDLRYRIWYPPQHGGIMISPEARKRMLDPSVPVREKNWGVTHHVTENCDCGMENIDITFLSPEDFGFDMSRWKQPFVSTFAGGFGWACTVNKTDESITAPALMCHIFRDIPGGIEHRTRFWLGYRMSNGKPELSLPPGIAVPAAAVQGLARHNVKEFKNFGAFLPEIYGELGGRFEV
jgi:hypothetical protein